MRDQITRILTNHKMSSLEGLHQLTGGDINDLKKACDELIEEGWLTTGTHEWNGVTWTVYKQKKKKNESIN